MAKLTRPSVLGGRPRVTLLSLLTFCSIAQGTVVPKSPAPPSTSTIYAYFEENLSSGSEVFLPTDSDFNTDVTQRWNVFRPPNYNIAVKPALETDVQTIIRYASRWGIPFLGTGGGHGYTTTTSAITNGIDMDLGFFRNVTVNAANNLMTIGGAVRFNDILDPLYSMGKEIQTGYCSCVGMVGATLGGGIGSYQGLYGLILDALVSVRIITGTGEIVTASKTQNSDLFWGVRGAGQNFGIITSATYQIHNLTNNGQAFNADFLFPASQNGTIYNILKSFAGNQPDEFSLSSAVQWSQEYNAAVIMVNAVYIGSPAAGLSLVQPFINSNPLVQNITVIPWNRLIKENRFGADALGCVKGGNHAVYGLNLYSFDVLTYVDIFNAYVDFFAQNPALRISLFVTEMHPNRITLQTPNDATSYPYRGTTAYIFFSFTFQDTSLEPVASAFALAQRQKLAKLSGASGLEVYVNYAHGDEGRNAWYTSAKLPRLQLLKARWDPGTLFNFTNGFA